MKVTVSLFATLRRLADDRERGRLTIDVEPGTRVSNLMERLQVPNDIPVIILVNDVQVQQDYEIREEDSVCIFPPIAGG